jgi:hypothetical protein
MLLPIPLKFTTGLLINLLLYIELALIQHCDIVGQHGYFYFGSISAIEGRLPTLDEQPRNHHIVSRLHQINKIIFKNHDRRTRNNSGLQCLVYLLYFNLLVIFVLCSAMHWDELAIVALTESVSWGCLLSVGSFLHRALTSSLFHIRDILLKRIRLLLNLPSAYRWQQEPVELVDIALR